MGGSENCKDFTSLPLWYAYYDGTPNCDNWSANSFGGWKPFAK
jgi:hypothetical protein